MSGEATRPLSYDELKALVTPLKDTRSWWNVRHALERAVPADGRAALYRQQQLAFATYKDPELRRSSALALALQALDVDPLTLQDDDGAESAALIGAVHKRLWELDEREDHVRRAISWYERGEEIAVDLDRASYSGYHAVNVAYLFDVLASREGAVGATALRERAREARVRALERIGGDADWWKVASRLECLVGLGRQAEIDDLLGDPGFHGCAARAQPWERESTATQIARLCTISDPAYPPGRRRTIVRAIVGEDVADIAIDRLGQRFGLALSGGGFRASLVHLGVLAAFADRGVLRHVEVLSCVSGGSIVGTAYYCALANELTGTADEKITDVALREVVATTIATFVGRITTNNLRQRAFLSPQVLLRRQGGSRTRRAGELYVDWFFRPLWKGGDDHRLDRLPSLLITPKRTDGGNDERAAAPTFRPKTGNWSRAAKVPTLLINATALGTGRPWRSTASSIGEPPSAADTDPGDRLEAIWFDRHEALSGILSVGDAVAASACVPGLFPPLAVEGLYDDRTVKLVDGGVYDNQGIDGLLEHDCTQVFVSDASGLIAEKRTVRSLVPSVLLRTNTIMMNAARAGTFATAEAMTDSRQVRASWRIHLLEGVEVHTIPATGGSAAPPASPTPHERLLRAIAAIRTDLDRFTTAEAWCLMARGYDLAMTALGDFGAAVDGNATTPWCFAPALRYVRGEVVPPPRLIDEIEQGHKLFGKWWPTGRKAMTEAELRA